MFYFIFLILMEILCIIGIISIAVMLVLPDFSKPILWPNFAEQVSDYIMIMSDEMRHSIEQGCAIPKSMLYGTEIVSSKILESDHVFMVNKDAIFPKLTSIAPRLKDEHKKALEFDRLSYTSRILGVFPHNFKEDEE